MKVFYSSIILDNIESTIESDILPALHGTKSFAIIIGTPYNKNDPVYKRIEDDGKMLNIDKIVLRKEQRDKIMKLWKL